MVNNLKDDPAALENPPQRRSRRTQSSKRTRPGRSTSNSSSGPSTRRRSGSTRPPKPSPMVVDALDEKPGARLSPSELNRRFLGPGREAQAYLRFGQVFLVAGKVDRAIKAFQRGSGLRPRRAAPAPLPGRGLPESRAGRPRRCLDGREVPGQTPAHGPPDLRPPRSRSSSNSSARTRSSPGLRSTRAIDPKNSAAPVRPGRPPTRRPARRTRPTSHLQAAILAEQRDTQDFAETFPRLLKERKTEELIAAPDQGRRPDQAARHRQGRRSRSWSRTRRTPTRSSTPASR